MPGHEALLRELDGDTNAKVIGVTGPPGAGKSTLVDALIQRYVACGMSVAVVCVDPSSPFSHGAVLGDRIRMNRWHAHPNVFIRSLSSRGALGGVNPMTIGVTELLRAEGFDRVIVETVGVGQSEVEIAGVADITVVVLVPEGGDDIQAMKAGLLEIADIFVVNKGDRPDFERFLNPGRKQMPDIDMDFDSRIRGEMIKYAAQRYGADRVAQIITFSTIKARAAVRDAARVLDYPFAIGDKIAKLMPPLIMGRDTPLRACFEPTPKYEDGYKMASELRERGGKGPASLRVGAMIEVPSILFEIDALMRAVDFVSVGSNDMMQFLFAADRENPRVASRFDNLSVAAGHAMMGVSLGPVTGRLMSEHSMTNTASGNTSRKCRYRSSLARSACALSRSACSSRFRDVMSHETPISPITRPSSS